MGLHVPQHSDAWDASTPQPESGASIVRRTYGSWGVVGILDELVCVFLCRAAALFPNPTPGRVASPRVVQILLGFVGERADDFDEGFLRGALLAGCRISRFCDRLAILVVATRQGKGQRQVALCQGTSVAGSTRSSARHPSHSTDQ